MSAAAALGRHHVFAHGSGCAAALLYAAGRSDVSSLTLASPVLSRALPDGSGVDGNVDTAAAEWSMLPATPNAVCFADALAKGSPALAAAWAYAPVDDLRAAAARIVPGTPTRLTVGGASEERGVDIGIARVRELLTAISTATPPPLEGVTGGRAERGGGESTNVAGGIAVQRAAPVGADATRGAGGRRTSPFLAGFPGVSEQRYPGCGHFAHLDDREAFIGDYIAFLDAVDGAAK